jgi:hypothetical protein
MLARVLVSCVAGWMASEMRLSAASCSFTTEEKQQVLSHIYAHQNTGTEAWPLTIKEGQKVYSAEVVRNGQFTFIHEPSKKFFLVIDRSKTWSTALEIYQCCFYGPPGAWILGIDEFLEVRALRTAMGNTSRVAQFDARIRERRRSGVLFIPDLPGPCTVTMSEAEVDGSRRVLSEGLEIINRSVIEKIRQEMNALHWDFKKVFRIEAGQFYTLAKSVPGKLVSSERGVGERYFDVIVDLRATPQVLKVFFPTAAPQEKMSAAAFDYAKRSGRSEIVLEIAPR